MEIKATFGIMIALQVNLLVFALISAYFIVPIRASPTATALNAVDFVDLNNGWAVGDSAFILHTTDGGESWSLQVNPFSGDPYQSFGDVKFIDLNNGWVVGTQGVILHTTDGGNSWSVQTSGTTRNLRTVDFVDTSHGWAASGGVIETEVISHTANGGDTWITQLSIVGCGFSSLKFIDANKGWAVGSGRIWHTTDGGLNWNVQLDSSDLFEGIDFIDLNNGWVVSGFGEILYTSDSGNTWNLQFSLIYLSHGIPEVPFGTVVSSLIMCMSLVGFLKFRRSRQNFRFNKD